MIAERSRSSAWLNWITAAGVVASTGAIFWGVVQWTADRNAAETMLHFQLDTFQREQMVAQANSEAHLHAIDGRLDSMERDGRDASNRVTRVETQLENIRSASTVPLSTRK